jgi:type III pantothenate kinase
VKTLVLNLGNTSLFGGVFRDGKLRKSFRLPTQATAAVGSRELSRLIATRVPGKIDRVVLCSVVPALTRKVTALLQRDFSLAPQILTADAPHGLKIGYRRPQELGTDRLAAALGARRLLPKRHVIVVDCGTATTVTALHRNGTLLGGAILPGLALWPAMLASRTAQLPEVPTVKPRVALGRSTRGALQSGFFHGHVGAIRELVGEIRREAFRRGDVLVVGTGGNAPRFSQEKIFDRIEPDLVLIGLNDFSLRVNAARL